MAIDPTAIKPGEVVFYDRKGLVGNPQLLSEARRPEAASAAAINLGAECDLKSIQRLRILEVIFD